MAQPAEVVSAVRHWAEHAGGEQMRRCGHAAIEAIRATPCANDAEYSPCAARIASIIAGMERAGRTKEARVLRVHYLAGGLGEAERLARLRRDGLAVSRAAYYIYLDAAHAYIAGALGAVEAP